MRPQTLMTLRRYHLYLGVFFAPALILFSISGALQTFRLNEEKGYGGPPPTWVVWLAAFHKNQGPPHEKAKPAPGMEAAKPAAPKPPAADKAKYPNPLPLQIFVVLMAIGLLLSTITGLVVALANPRTRRTYVAILVAGVVVPLALFWL